MPRPSLRRASALALCLILAASGPLLAKQRPETLPSLVGVSHTGPASFLAPLWSFLLNLWSKSGCSIDPYGGCTTGQGASGGPPESTDSGCHFDPFGGCLPGS